MGMSAARNDGAIPLVSYMRQNLTAVKTVWLQWPLFILFFFFFFFLDPSNLLIHTETEEASRGRMLHQHDLEVHLSSQTFAHYI